MADYLLSNKAVDDLTDIWNYTYDYWLEKQADKYYEGLVTASQKIAENPKIGKNYDEIDHSILEYLYKKHILFYTTLSSEEIQIVRILHSSMDLKNRIIE